MKLTMTLEHSGRHAKRVVASIQRNDIDSAVYSMLDECERPSPGERMRKLYNDARDVDPNSILPWLEVSEARRGQWEELARLAKAAAEKGEL